MSAGQSLNRVLPSAVAPTVAGGRFATGLRVGVYIAALIGLGAIGSILSPAVREGQPGDPAQNGAGWEGRRLIAQLLWVKTHAVLHAGMEEREARAGEGQDLPGYHTHGKHGEEKAEGGSHSGAGEHADEDGHVPVILSARRDFRGFLGDLERQVKPYLASDGQEFSKDPEQTVPFYRLMTWADPHFIQGYTLGATFIAKGGKYADRGIQFLLEGERANPHSFEIQTELGHFYLVYKKDPARAEAHLVRAIQLAPPHDKQSEGEQESFLDAYHWLVLAYVKSGQPEQAVRLAKQGLRYVAHDPTFSHVLKYHGRDWTHQDVARD